MTQQARLRIRTVGPAERRPTTSHKRWAGAVACPTLHTVKS